MKRLKNSKVLNKYSRFATLAAIVLMVLFATACGSAKQGDMPETPQQEAAKDLALFFKQNGNYIASPAFPAVMSATDLYLLRDSNILVIDLRDAEQFASGAIPGAINLRPDKVISFFNAEINAKAFNRIVFTDSRGQVAAHVAGIMRLLGFDNVFSVRFGMSGWTKTIAAAGWDLAFGDSLINHISKSASDEVIENYPLPQLSLSGNTPYERVLQRADTLLSGNTANFLLSFKEVVQHPEKYFVINYVSEDQFLNFGHLEGAVRFTPRQPLVSDNFLSSLPTDKAIVVYCHTGHQSAHLTAYLRMLGYNAYSIIYGANSFMHNALTKSASPNHCWSEAQKNDFPVTTGQNTNDQSAAPIEIKAVKGGC